MNLGASDATDPPAAVVVRDLCVRRGGSSVFDGLDLEVARGGVTGLMGPSGCGKTTLMRAIVGTQRVRAGSVTVLGQEAGSAGLRHRVAYDTQAASVYSDLSVEQNLRYFARLVGAPRSDVGRVLDQVNLRGQAGRRVDTLSGGQASRVSLAVAILGRPELVVLDEPTVGLDPLLREELWAVFRSLVAEGTTLIVSSHVMDEALRCDRLLLMRDGRVMADTTPARLLSETGASDPDRAFLALIEKGAG
ncbi:ABC transporter ATP-binding protein [Nocardiopsis sp. L17-MgMaSL7]|uniref:ABC transporter ATP-binding protein n=1 Tax=Nocardiopsis sp. L17-MgMaSL7 TaxID=1938893 RepID=UPI000D711410|nr:ABC transporter ATP-binding protein [Nocardiopsis sp. L17-MgMaSL7]PWV57388.1 ABC-2 type transport system ATP-binding protein [Nocardiopsis sp. L17-MgMaSL7]